MPTNFGSRVFTQVVKELQEQYGSRRQYERLGGQKVSTDRLTADEREFIAERDSFYMATVGSSGWPYVQHRGGPKGFLKVVDEGRLAFGDYRGNRQYVSAGNLGTDPRVALIMVDYPRRARLKILGRVSIFEGEAAKPWMDRVKDPRDQAVVERVYVIDVEAFDWNCPQHITPRFSVDEIQAALVPFEKRLQELEEENERLRRELSGGPGAR
ncbi:pyridoxamine 5'-phosphate oxidase family protein [Paludibaculum fermentans]|uniref:pyridoxamine 5'-phosphate oxidase family protein n=1 Tax=Paludibaculum fermentans TaxID=1473598 RepID=UPI003EBFF8E8